MTKIMFTLDYIQVDNQAAAEPGYPVILRPRDLLFIKGKVKSIV
jgi:hypothetical protein